MEKKRDRKKPKPKEKNSPATQPGTTPSNPTQKDDSFDFGGLPDRNLKKNLGCG